MKKTPIICLALLALSLTSCGSSDDSLDAVVITPDTEIESRAQSAKVCEPFIKYLECSLEKAPEASKDIHQKIYDDTK